jgi:lipopolysaccharide export system permease protein
MRRIDRYIVSSVSASILLVMLVVLSLDMVFAFVAEVEDLSGGYQVPEAITFVLTTLPRRIYDYLPLGAFMGCLIGLGVLAKNSELVVVRAAGVSIVRIVFSAMKPALVIILLAMALGEFVVPFSEKIAQSKKAVAQGADLRIASSAGLWHREGDVFVHINAVEPNGILHGVSLQHYLDDRSIRSTLFAKRAIYQRGEWLLEDVRETLFSNGEASKVSEPYRVWETSLSPSLLSILIVKPDNLSISGLYRYVEYLQKQNLNASSYLISFWKKVLQPLSTLVLVFVAISFVFGPLRSVTMGYRIFCGLVVGLAFKYMQDLLGPSSLVFGFNPIFATLIPIAICALLGSFLIRRVG